MNINRREMLKLGTAAGAFCLAGGSRCLPALAATAKIPVALELWSVRDECKKDLARVLGMVAEMGYQAVELAHDDYGFDGPAWRKLLDKNGLKVCGMHTLMPKLEGDGFQRMVDFQQAIGNRNLILAALPHKNLSSVAGMKEAAEQLNRLAERLKPQGMRIGYHCHAGDFAPAEGKIPWVVLGENTRPEVIMQLDIANCMQGGGDYLAMLDKFATRAVSIHVKDYGGPAGAILGEGKAQWPEVFKICESKGAIEWYIIEEESRNGPESLDVVRRCLQNLHKMGR